ncbi:MAG: hypothetical protein QNK04_28655 [Myxococcota bacterium]|nr:hypothetical protein [Myxococcota bacterium]
MIVRIGRVASLALILLAPSAALAGVDGAKPMLCAVTEAIECNHEEECSRGTVESMNIPPFLRIEPGRKLMTEHKGERKTTVQTVTEKDGHIVLQGFENRAFSVSISKETGRLTATATGPDAGFVLFGICTDL